MPWLSDYGVRRCGYRERDWGRRAGLCRV